MSEVLSKDTVALIQETAVKASGAINKVAIVTPECEPDHVYLVVKPDGTCDRREAGPEPRAHRLAGIDQVVPFVAAKMTANTVVWYDRDGVHVVLDDTTRRDVAILKFVYTSQFARVMLLDVDRPGFTQKDFRKLIRIELAGCFDSPRLLNWVSDVRFGAASNTAGNLRSDRESLGKDVDAQAVSGAGEIPDQVPLSVRVFDDPALVERQGVACVFDLDVQAQQFRLIPLPLEVHSAIERELLYVREKLGDELEKLGVPLFRGRP